MDRAGQERRSVDGRVDRVENDLRSFIAGSNEERTMMHEDLARARAWQEGHDKQCAERWNSNTDKWTANEKRFDGMDTKLNAIIGTSFITLLAVCGFFITIWIDRQESHANTHTTNQTHIPQ